MTENLSLSRVDRGYMTISIALLGYAAAGSAYYAFPGRSTRLGVDPSLAGWALVALLLAMLGPARRAAAPA